MLYKLLNTLNCMLRKVLYVLNFSVTIVFGHKLTNDGETLYKQEDLCYKWFYTTKVYSTLHGLSVVLETICCIHYILHNSGKLGQTAWVRK